MVYIERLVCKGFKSFGRDTVSIKFSPGFTCIVGPNGSGKSNVVDAILFSLGQLSAKTLRANVFSDLLYSPPKPDMPPKAKSAVVEVHFNNKDRQLQIESDKVVVQRELDGSGKAICRVNGKVVTRATVLEVLGTIGVDPNGYNLVLQGEIAQMVKVSPIDRRRLIEEIAGISAYDEQKERALKKLAESEANLGKVEMQLQERRRQLEKLEMERGDALRHQELQNRIKAFRIDSLAWTAIKSRSRVQTINETLAERANETEELIRELAEVENGTAETEREIEEIDSEIDLITGGDSARISEHYGLVSAAMEHVKNDLERSKLEYEKEHQEYDSLENELESVKEQIASMESIIQEKNDILTKIENEIEESTRKSVRLEEHLEKEQVATFETTQRLQELNNEMRSLDESISEVRSVIKSDNRELGLAYEELRDAEESLKRTDEELSHLNERVPAKREELQTGEDKLSSLRSELDDLMMRLNRLNAEVDESAKVVRSTREELIRVQARQDALKEAEEAFLKRRRAIARVLDLRDSGVMGGIHGTVAELGTIDPDYAVALEVAGGNRLSYIVVDTETVATDCVNVLKGERIGRASFIPLNKIKTRKIGKLPKDKGVVGYALDLVQFEEKMRPAFEFVFSDTIVTEDFATAKSLGFKGWRTVSLEGDLVEKSGLMTGGHYQRSPTGISLQVEDTTPQIEEKLKGLEEILTDLREKQQQIQKRKVDLEKEVQDLSQTQYRLSLELERMEENLQEKDAKSEALKHKIGETKLTIDALESQIAKLRTRDDELTMKRENVRTQRDDCNETLAKSDAAKISQYLKDLKEVLEHHRRERETAQNEVTGLQVALEERLRPKAIELEMRLQSLNAVLPALESDVKAHEESLAEKEKEFLELKSRRLQIDDAVKDKRVRQLELREKLRNLRLRHEEIREAQTSNEKAVYRLQTEQSRLETDIVGLIAELNVVSEASIELEKREDQRELSYREIEDFDVKIKEHNRELEALGPVNLRALSDYDIEKERYEEIVDKKARLEEEHKEILAFMEEIEAEKTRKFLTVYNEIADNFAKVFAKLSPEGEASLMLENPEHPLMGGITVRSKPRGKELVTLDAMSGGEKTLTGLALIFAIQMYSPASFYIFDEIDANLDDVNAHNVALLISEMSKSSQFVIVSLRDTTVRKADLLVGVSNQDGISRIVSVDLEEVAATS